MNVDRTFLRYSITKFCIIRTFLLERYSKEKYIDNFSVEFPRDKKIRRRMDRWPSFPATWGEICNRAHSYARSTRDCIRIDSGGYEQECSLGDRIIQFFSSPLRALIAFQRHKFPRADVDPLLIG